jgi:hypothetical protein
MCYEIFKQHRSLSNMNGEVILAKSAFRHLFFIPMNSGAIIQISKKSASGVWEHI